VNVRTVFFSVDGTVVLNTGAITTTNASTFIGNIGAGQMTVSNGTWLARDVALGFHVGSAGTLTVAGGTNTIPYLLGVAMLGRARYG